MRPVADAIGALVIGLLAGGTSAWATSIDLSTWTCAKFHAADKNDIGVILAWMDGYYRGEDDPPVIDTEKFVANAKKLGDFARRIRIPASLPRPTSCLRSNGRAKLRASSRARARHATH
jgi:acid stress chaperone HdeB